MQIRDHLLSKSNKQELVVTRNGFITFVIIAAIKALDVSLMSAITLKLQFSGTQISIVTL